MRKHDVWLLGLVRRRSHAWVIAALSLLFAVPSALAQTAADRETARSLLDRGDEQFEKGEFAAALALYRGAHAIMHVPTTGIEVARSYEKLGNLVEARGAALEVLRMPKAVDDPAPFKVARAAAEQLARALTDQIPSLRIEVYPQEASEHASLTIDGGQVPVAAVGLPYTLNPTEHLLRLSAPGYRTIEQTFALSRGEHKSLRLDLTPLQTTEGPRRSNGSVNQLSGAVTVPVSSRQESPVERGSLGWPAWLGIGLAGTGLAVGTVAGIVSLERTKSAKAYCQGNYCSPNARSDRDAALTSANISNVGFAMVLVGATVCVTSIWVTHSRAKKVSPTAVRLGVSPIPAGAALHLDGATW